MKETTVKKNQDYQDTLKRKIEKQIANKIK